MRNYSIIAFVFALSLIGCTDTARIKELEAQNNILEGKILEARDKLSNISSRMSELESAISNLSQSGCYDAAAELESAYDDLQSEVEDLEADL